MKYLFIISFLVFVFITDASSQSDENDTIKFKTETIDVNAIRGIEGLTPVTLQDVKRENIEDKYWMQDLPMFLNGNTSINAYSESGSSVGYSYFSLRGFDQRRVSILLNGIPQNDAEDHQVYWVDLSDITSSVENIQIQRGIGTSLYGTSGIGGVINISTIDYFNRKFTNFNSGYGSYNSKRFSLEYSSGLTGDGFAFYGKLSRMKTDGYREFSWSDHWSYFLSAGKIFNSNVILKFNAYGSPIKNHLAYIGVTKDYLDGKITGNKVVDRKYNFLYFPNESDNYFQPRYELVLNAQLSDNLFLSNTLNYTRGEGYFITNFPVSYGYDFAYFRLKPFYTSDSTIYNSSYYKRNPDGSLYFEEGKGFVIDKSDLVTNLYVNNNDYGWYPKIQIKHSKGRGNLVIGGEVRLHNSEHYGEITFGNALPTGTPVNYRYYYYEGKKTTISAYANEMFNISEKLIAMAGLQFAFHKYNIQNDEFKPYNFNVDYNFLTPRFGLNFNFTENFRVFANFSIAKREPRLKDIYNAEDPYSRPNFAIIDTVKNIYENPLVKEEQMLDYEIGFSYKNYILKSNLNFYLMDFTNEIVSNGQLDNVGQPINGNAGKSIHRGIEFDFELNPFAKYKNSNFLKGINLSGNISLSDNYFKDYVEKLGVDSIGNVIYGNDYSGNRIILSPSVMGNLTIGYNSTFGLNAYISVQYIGKQYLDNSENERKNPSAREVQGYVNKYINPYSVFNAGISFDLIPLLKFIGVKKSLINSFEFSLKVNNVFDRLYETSGSVDWSGTPYWIPAADRNYYLNLKIGL